MPSQEPSRPGLRGITAGDPVSGPKGVYDSHMNRRSMLMVLVVLVLAGCGSARQQQAVEQPAVSVSDGVSVFLTQSLNTELTAQAGETLFQLKRMENGRQAASTDLQYLGLADDGRIRLRVEADGKKATESWRSRLRQEGYAPAASGPVDFEQAPAETFMVDGFQIEFIKAQASWVRYRITNAAAS